MKRLALTLILLCSTITASAGDFGLEVGLGFGAYELKKDGTYYQDALENEKHTQDQFFKLGLAYNTDRYSLHGGYISYGEYSLDSLAIPDNEYMPGVGCYHDDCRDSKVALFRGTGHARGLYATLSTPKSSRLYVEAGITYLSPTWHFDAYHTYSGDLTNLEYDGGKTWGRLFAIGYRFSDDVLLAYTHSDIKGGPSEYPIATKGHNGLMLVYSF
jgi:hypothetical protein